MRRGKADAQVAHASMGAFTKHATITSPEPGLLNLSIPIPEQHTEAILQWLTGSFTKIVAYVETEEELVSCYEQALAAGLPCSIITDSGKTEFNGVPTRTTVAIGPADSELIDTITGKLGLI